MIREPIGQALLHLLSNCVHDSTVGVAVFDKALLCRAYNGTFFVMQGGPDNAPLGKTMQQLFGEEAHSLEPALQRAWSTGNSTSNCPPLARAACSATLSRWVVNFYPVKDALGCVHLIATTFSEVSRRNNAELQLTRLKDKLHADVSSQQESPGGDFSRWNARVLGLVESSIATLKSSTRVRQCSSVARMESGLGQMEFSLTVTEDRKGVATLAIGSEAPSDTAPSIAVLSPPAPSRRERQVLLHLADGKSNKQIAVVLNLSTRTVETYRARLMFKLQLHSTAELVRYAIRHQISAA